MLNILMTFAQFEREILTERVRDKVAAAKKRGKHCGGRPVLGYDSDPITKKLLGDTKIKRTKSLLCEIFEHRGNKENSKWSERAA